MESRGNESAGIGAVVAGDIEICKKAVSPSEFIELPDVATILDKNPKIVIGHTRLKTVGAIVDKNAHPFQHGRIMGAHNGSVSNWLEVYIKGEVDSEAIFWQLDQDKNKFKETLPKLSGTMAITWVDETNPFKVHLVRHTSPLFLIFSKEIESYVWCSTELALKASFVALFGELPDKIVELPEDEVFIIANDLSMKKVPVTFKETAYRGSYRGNLPATTTNELATVFQNGSKFAKRFNKDSKWTIADGLVDTFDEDCQTALTIGCMNCKKQISIHEPFFFRQSAKAVIHGRCLKAYSKEIRKNSGISIPYYLLFSKEKHKLIREIIAATAVKDVTIATDLVNNFVTFEQLRLTTL